MLSQVTHHSAIFPPSMRDTAPKIKLRPPPRRWKWPHWPLLRPLIRGPCSDEIPLGDGALFIRFAGGETIALFVRFSSQSTTTNNRGNPS